MRRALLILGLVVGVVGLIVASLSIGSGDDALWPLSWIGWAPVGYLILTRRPGNGVGVALMFIGATMGASFLAATLATADSASLKITSWVQLASVILEVVPWLGVIWLVLVFPSGRLEGTGERLVGFLTVLGGTLAVAAFAVSPFPMRKTGPASPLEVPALGEVSRFFTDEPGFHIPVVLMLASMVLLFMRWRRSQGVPRAQFRWFLLGVLIFVVILLVSQFIPEDSPLLYLFFPAGLAIPTTIGMAILRYRLYDIDRIISRTVTYASVVGLLGLVVTGLVAGLAFVLPSDDPLVVAVSTLAAAALFNPVRKRVQTLVDRRFNRSGYDAEAVIDDFAASLREPLHPDKVIVDWVDLVSETMQPSSVSAWVRRGEIP